MHADLLFIIAEIAAAFAGFASLVAAISRRSSPGPQQDRLDFGTLQNVLLLSLLSVGFALFPNVLERQGLSAAIAWRTSAAAFAIVVGTYVGYVLRTLPAAYRELGRRVPPSFVFNAVLIILGLSVQVLCAAGLVPLATYLLPLSTILYAAGFGFVRLFVSLRPDSPTAG